jgi:hypothetical protein
VITILNYLEVREWVHRRCIAENIFAFMNQLTDSSVNILNSFVKNVDVDGLVLYSYVCNLLVRIQIIEFKEQLCWSLNATELC